MWWQYLLVFLGSLLMDTVPLFMPPAFTLMVFLQIYFDLNIWIVIVIGVAGSMIGRYILTLYIPRLSNKIFNPAKNEDVQFLGEKLKQKGWKSQAFILGYSLLPLPTTPIFIAGGMARMKPYFILPMFAVGRFISVSTAVLTGNYATENTEKLLEGIVSWQSISGLGVGLLLIFALLFIDWRTLLQDKRLTLKFNIWK